MKEKFDITYYGKDIFGSRSIRIQIADVDIAKKFLSIVEDTVVEYVSENNMDGACLFANIRTELKEAVEELLEEENGTVKAD